MDVFIKIDNNFAQPMADSGIYRVEYNDVINYWMDLANILVWQIKQIMLIFNLICIYASGWSLDSLPHFLTTFL